jgi:hypothetical protein
MTDRELMQQALEALEFHVKNADEIEEIDLALVTALRERLAQKPNMPEQYVMVGRFMLQPHPQNGYWLTDTGTSEGMQIFQPEMEQVIKKLWSQF